VACYRPNFIFTCTCHPIGPVFNSKSVHVGFMVDRLASVEFPPPLKVLHFSSVDIIPPLLHNHLPVTGSIITVNYSVVNWTDLDGRQ